jgi:hypothetical protein
MIYGSSPAPAPAVPPVTAPPAAARGANAKPDNIEILLARIRAAKAAGQPTDDLRKELMEAVAGYKQ